jgi:uncharacterized damage-inducible protein DinB
MLRMDELLGQAFRYHRWANLRLLDVCASLQPKQLKLTVPGTYGTIADTWQHLLSAEQRYLYRLGGPRPQLNERSRFPGIARLKRHAERTADGLIAAAGRVKPGAARDFTFRSGRVRLSLWVIAVQALHHGNDHRTHVCSVLGANGIEYGELDVWAFGAATGGETLLGPKQPSRRRT